MKTSIQTIMTTITSNVQATQVRLNQACFTAGRHPETVHLLAVSKLHPAEAVRQAHAAGLCAFGENYVQEGLDKIAVLADLRPVLAWHLIGPLQSNKARAVAALPRLRLRGLMSIPEPERDLEAQRRPHRALRELFDQLNAEGLGLDTLSMGMSADLEAAILEGATLVRIGTAIFGARTP